MVCDCVPCSRDRIRLPVCYHDRESTILIYVPPGQYLEKITDKSGHVLAYCLQASYIKVGVKIIGQALSEQYTALTLYMLRMANISKRLLINPDRIQLVSNLF